jgi:copper chaperone CopZ
MSDVEYTVPSISCMHCTSTIERELMELEGVRQVSATLDGKLVRVTFEPPANAGLIESTLADINYPVAT